MQARLRGRSHFGEAKARLCILLGLLALLLPSATFADTAHLVVSQIQVAGERADDEFVELYNPTDHETSLDGWSLQYKSASSAKFLKKNFPTGAAISARSYYLISNSGGNISGADMSHSSFSMAADGGTVFLVSTTTLLADGNAASIVDKVGYGTASISEISPAPAAPAKQALERKPGGTAGSGTDADNNASDFLVTTSHPRSRGSPVLPKSDGGGPAAAAQQTTPTTSSSTASETTSETVTVPPASSTTAAPLSTDSASTSATQQASQTQTSQPTVPQQQQTTSQTQTPAPAAGTIVLNEVLPDPLEGSEWIELFSASTSAITLDGATIEDAQGIVATLSGSIGADTRFLVVAIPVTRLNNSGDAVVLKWSDGTVLDRMTYGDENDGVLSDNAPAVGKGVSLIRLPDGARSGNDAVDWKPTATPTKGASNRLTTPSAGSGPLAVSRNEIPTQLEVPAGAVRVNEWVADPPDQGVEWVEILNTTTMPISLAGWVLEEGGGEYTALSGVIGTSEFDRYLVINNPKGSLNNSGDRIAVRDTARRLIDEVSYGNWNNTSSANAPTAPDPWAVARVSGLFMGTAAKMFAVTTTPTPNAANRITPPPQNTAPSAPPKTTPSSAPTVSASSTPIPAQPNLPPTVLFDAPDEAGVGELVLFDASSSLDPEGKPLTFTWEVEGALSKTTNNARLEHIFKNPGRILVMLTVSDGTHKSKIRHRIRVVPAATDEPTNKKTDKSGEPKSETRNKKLEIGDEDENEKGERRTREKKTKVVIREAVVTAPFGLLGARKFAASPVGIIHVSKGDLPKLAVGSRVRLTGRAAAGQTDTALYLKNSNDLIVSKTTDPPEPEAVEVADLSELEVGTLVRLTGEVEATRGRQITISEDGEQFFLLLPLKTKLSSQLFVEGDAIAATGILRKTSSGFAVVPRQPEDVEWLARAAPQPNPNQPKNASGLATSLTTAALAGILYGLWRLVSRRSINPITFPNAQDEQTGILPEKPRPLLLDGTYPEKEVDGLERNQKPQ